MKKFIFFSVFTLFLLTTRAQRVYFLYLQTDNGQPFYAKIDEKPFSSTASGYLILSKLRDTVYTISIGFTGNQAPEQRFSIPINRKDHGYLVKNFGEKGWGLFDLQTMAILSPITEKNTGSIKTEQREQNAFTDLLARAADDPSLKEKSILVNVEEKKATVETVVLEEKKPEPKKTVPETQQVKTDEPVKEKIKETKDIVKTEEKKGTPKDEIKNPSAKNTGTRKDDVAVEKKKVKTVPPPEVKTVAEKKTEIKDTVANTAIDPGKETITVITKSEENPAEQEYKRSKILRRSESSTTEGFGLTFWDVQADGQTDTIRILIPNLVKGLASRTDEPEQKKEEKRFVEISPIDSIQKEIENTPAVVRKNYCKETASENDFFKLRKKMAAASSDNNMLSEAKKAFRMKCYSTFQLRNLSTLFLRDEGKYKFFDVAYSYVTDPANFGSLQSELKDEYFVARFKVMVK